MRILDELKSLPFKDEKDFLETIKNKKGSFCKEIKNIHNEFLGLFLSHKEYYQDYAKAISEGELISYSIRYKLPNGIKTLWKFNNSIKPSKKVKKHLSSHHSINEIMYIKEPFFKIGDNVKYKYSEPKSEKLKYTPYTRLSAKDARYFIKIVDIKVIKTENFYPSEENYNHKYELQYSYELIDKDIVLNSKKDEQNKKYFHLKLKGQKRTYTRDDKYKTRRLETSWQFPPIHQDIVKADSKKDAIEEFRKLYEKEFPTRVLRTMMESNRFLLVCDELNVESGTYKELTLVQTCKECGIEFTKLEKYKKYEEYEYHGNNYCCRECKDIAKHKQKIKEQEDGVFHEGFTHAPIIYKITNKENGMSYIGQTRQAVTLRWYQHFYQSKGSKTKFHTALRGTKFSDWLFEVLEEVESRFSLDEREQYWINEHNSIDNGYNTAIANKIENERNNYSDGLFDEVTGEFKSFDALSKSKE